MAGDLVLITGATGHLGYRVLVDALEAGYKVRLAVRSQSKAQKILDAPSIKALSPGENLTFVEVPDMIAKGSYEEAIKGATYAIHIASPISDEYKEGDDMYKTFVEPAVTGTINMLEAAQKAGSVKRIVITSSVVAIRPFGAMDRVYNETDRTPFPLGPYSNAFEGYAASKVKALNDAEAWVEKEKPSFDLVHIFPSFIIGGDELITKTEDAFRGTNNIVLGPVAGAKLGTTPGMSIHLLDVAFAHVKALDSTVPGNQGYVLSAEATKWETALDIVAKEFPDAVKSGKIPNNGIVDTVPMGMDRTRSEEVLGFKYKPFEEQVKHVVAHYLTLL